MNQLENQQAAEQIDRIYMDLEELLMQNIMRHCQDYGQPIATDEWLLKKLAEIGKLNKENIKLIAQSAGLSRTAVERMLNEAAEEALGQVEPALAYLTRQGLVGESVELPKSKSVQKTVKTLQDQAKETTNLCNTTMLYKARDAYKKFVTSIASEASEIAQKQDFIDSLNKHATATVIGAESRQQAVRKCIKEFNDKGIPVFVDKKGREWTPEAYVNMAMRNTAKNVADEVQSARCQDYGVNLIEISSHSGARPKCAKDQGKIYDLNNGSGYVEDAVGKKVRYYPWNSTSYGEPDGILGINCTHHKFPFWPGMSLQTYFPAEDQEASDRLYKQTQVQRAMERDIRKQKRLCMLYDEAGEKDAFEDASVALKQKEAKLKNYIDKTPQLHRRKDREQVVGFDRSISAKATGSAQKHYKEWAKSIGAESGPKTLAGYYDLKYNNSKESQIYKGYVKAVSKGNISPLVGYEKFKEIYENAEKSLVGLKLSDGREVNGITVHLAERIIGQQAAGDEPVKGMRMGVDILDIEEAVVHGKVGDIKTDKDGRKSLKVSGRKCTVTFNPDLGVLIQTEPRSTR